MSRSPLILALHPTRRALLRAAPAALSLPFVTGRPARAATEKVVVVTSFPEELTTRYEQEFEKRYPGAHVQFVWKQSRDALAYLSAPNQSGADVYWAPSIGNFPILRDRGVFQKISVDRAALPGKLGAETLSDPFFEAYDVAGYGVAIAPALLKERGLPTPKRWRDLASPAYAGHIAAPIPSRVGFAPALYDIVLQAEGWESGWALLSEISAGAELLASGPGPTANVREGKFPLALSIDFFALQEEANGLPVAFVYPERTAFLPAHVAMTASTKNPALAKAFIDFSLSRAGQKLMMEMDSSRHPARPDAYVGAPANIVDPFALPQSAIFPYDSEVGRRRPGLVNLLFDLALVEPHAEVATLWRVIRAAEAKGAPQAAEARRLAGLVPVSTKDADSPAFLEGFASRDSKDDAVVDAFRKTLADNRARATALLADAHP